MKMRMRMVVMPNPMQRMLFLLSFSLSRITHIPFPLPVFQHVPFPGVPPVPVPGVAHVTHVSALSFPLVRRRTRRKRWQRVMIWIWGHAKPHTFSLPRHSIPISLSVHSVPLSSPIPFSSPPIPFPPPIFPLPLPHQIPLRHPAVSLPFRAIHTHAQARARRPRSASSPQTGELPPTVSLLSRNSTYDFHIFLRFSLPFSFPPISLPFSEFPPPIPEVTVAFPITKISPIPPHHRHSLHGPMRRLTVF